MLPCITFRGFIRWLWLKLTGKQVVIRGHCLQCGNCCRRISLMVDGKWIKTEKQFNEALKEFPDFSRFTPIPREKSEGIIFTCTHLTKDNLCGDYSGRPDLCRRHPTLNTWFNGAEIGRYCGYYYSVEKSFGKCLRKAHEKEEGSTEPDAPGDKGDRPPQGTQE